jgi:hypothetical protein
MVELSGREAVNVGSTTVVTGAGLSSRQRSFLRYWSVGLVLLLSFSEDWIPGFPYEVAEIRRALVIARTVPRSVSVVWLAMTGALCLAIAAAIAAGLVMPAMAVLWPLPAEAPPVGVAALLLLMAAASVGLGVTLSLAGSGVVANWIAPRRAIWDQPGDLALYAKAWSQLLCCGGIVAFCLVPVLLAILAWAAKLL